MTGPENVVTVCSGGEDIVTVSASFHDEMDHESRQWVIRHLDTFVRGLFANALANSLEGRHTDCPDCNP